MQSFQGRTGQHPLPLPTGTAAETALQWLAGFNTEVKWNILYFIVSLIEVTVITICCLCQDPILRCGSACIRRPNFQQSSGQTALLSRSHPGTPRSLPIAKTTNESVLQRTGRWDQRPEIRLVINQPHTVCVQKDSSCMQVKNGKIWFQRQSLHESFILGNHSHQLVTAVNHSGLGIHQVTWPIWPFLNFFHTW